jgi:hypothetical protein
MLLPMFDGLVRTTVCDPEMLIFADRHYSKQSRGTVGGRRLCGPARSLVLRDQLGDVLFIWQWPKDGMRRDGQNGFNCVMFRNESSRLSSEIILEAEKLAVQEWGPNRFYTYVDPDCVRSQNPGYCFKVAGWKYQGLSKVFKRHLLAKHGTIARRALEGK